MDDAILYVYSYDISDVTGCPDVVVRPSSTEEIARIVATCAREKIPVIPRGAGTGATGGAVAIDGGVVIELTRMAYAIAPLANLVPHDNFDESGYTNGHILKGLIDNTGQAWAYATGFSIDATVVTGGYSGNCGQWTSTTYTGMYIPFPKAPLSDGTWNCIMSRQKVSTDTIRTNYQIVDGPARTNYISNICFREKAHSQHIEDCYQLDGQAYSTGTWYDCYFYFRYTSSQWVYYIATRNSSGPGSWNYIYSRTSPHNAVNNVAPAGIAPLGGNPTYSGTWLIDDLQFSWTPSFIKADWNVYSTPFNLSSKTDNTQYIVGYNSTDNNGVLEPTNNVTVTLDTSPPTTNITAGSYGYTNDSNYWAKVTTNTYAETFEEYSNGQNFVESNYWLTDAGAEAKPVALTGGAGSDTSTVGKFYSQTQFVGAILNFTSLPQSSTWNYLQMQAMINTSNQQFVFCALGASVSGGALVGDIAIYGFDAAPSGTGSLMYWYSSAYHDIPGSTYTLGNWYYFRVWWNDATNVTMLQVSSNGISWTTYNNDGNFYQEINAGTPHVMKPWSHPATCCYVDNIYICMGTSFALLETNTGGGPINQPSATTGYKYTCNGVEKCAWTVGTVFMLPAGSATGTYVIYYTGWDSVGNNETSLSTFTVLVDANAPVTTASYSSCTNGSINWVSNYTTFTLMPSDSWSGVNKTGYAVSTSMKNDMDFAGGTAGNDISTITNWTSMNGAGASTKLVNWPQQNSKSNYTVNNTASGYNKLCIECWNTGAGMYNITYPLPHYVPEGNVWYWISFECRPTCTNTTIGFALDDARATVNGVSLIFCPDGSILVEGDKCSINATSSVNYAAGKDYFIRIYLNPSLHQMYWALNGTVYNNAGKNWDWQRNYTEDVELLQIDGSTPRIGSPVAYITNIDFSWQHTFTASSWASYSTPFTISGQNLYEPIYIGYNSTDNFGNIEFTHLIIVELKPDNTAPTTTAAFGSPRYFSGTTQHITSSSSISLSATDGAGESGVAFTAYALGGENFNEFTNNQTISGTQWTITGTSGTSYFRAISSSGMRGEFYDLDANNQLDCTYTFLAPTTGAAGDSVTWSITPQWTGENEWFEMRIKSPGGTHSYMSLFGLGILPFLFYLHCGNANGYMEPILSVGTTYIITFVVKSATTFYLVINGIVYNNNGSYYTVSEGNLFLNKIQVLEFTESWADGKQIVYIDNIYEYAAYNGAFTLDTYSIENGTCQFHYYSQDYAGNVESVKSQNITVHFLNYLATWSFNNSNGLATLSGWNPSSPDSSVFITNETGTNGAGALTCHENVLALNDGATAFQNFTSAMSTGSIDFYCMVGDLAEHDIELQHYNGSAWTRRITIRLKNGTIQVNSSGAFVDGRYGPLQYNTNYWYEFHVEFNYNSSNFKSMAGELLPEGEFNVWINTVLEFANASMTGTPGPIRQLMFTQLSGKSYFDAVDYSWISSAVRNMVVNSSANRTFSTTDFKVYHDITVLGGATFKVTGAGTTLYMDGALVVKPNATLTINNGAIIDARDGLNWCNYGNASFGTTGNHFDTDCMLGGTIEGNNANLELTNGTLACDGMNITYTKIKLMNDAVVNTNFMWTYLCDENTPFFANYSTITCNKSFSSDHVNGTNAITLDHDVLNAPLIYLQAQGTPGGKITIETSTINGMLILDTGTYGTILDSKIMALMPTGQNLSQYWGANVISTSPGATIIGINVPWMALREYNGTSSRYLITPGKNQFPGTAFSGYTVQKYVGNGNCPMIGINYTILQDFTGSDITVLVNLPRFDHDGPNAIYDWDVGLGNNIQIRDCTWQNGTALAFISGDMQTSSGLLHLGEWDSMSSNSITVVNCEFISTTTLFHEPVTNWTGWWLGNLPVTSTIGFYLTGNNLPKNPNKELTITYVNCWFPHDYRAFFGFPGGADFYYERWDSDIYREQYTFIDCNVNVSSQVVFFGKGSAVVSAMNVSARGIPRNWTDCQKRMQWYKDFSTTNTTLTIPNKSISVTLAIPGNCYYGAGLAMYRGSCTLLSLNSSWINKTFAIPIPVNDNYSILFYATFDGAFYQTRRDLGFVVPNGAANLPRMLSSAHDVSYPIACSNNMTHSITWLCTYSNFAAIGVTLNGIPISGAFNNTNHWVTITPFNNNFTTLHTITFTFIYLAEGEYRATITVNGTDHAMLEDTALVTVLAGNKSFDTISGVTLYNAGLYASVTLQQPFAINWLLTNGSVSISVGMWNNPLPPLPANISGSYIGIYACNQRNIQFPFYMTIPLPPGYTEGTLYWFSWNSTTSSWTRNQIPYGNIHTSTNTATIQISHLSMYGLVIYNAFSFAKFDLTSLVAIINATSKSSWGDPCEKQSMLDKIGLVSKLFDNGYYAAAYDMLLHDIKPKLTGLKTDENETLWGNGVFKNPWIVDPALRLKLRDVIDYALADIQACHKTTINDALGSLGNNMAALETLVNRQLSGSKKEACDGLISNATTLYSVMQSGFEQNKMVNCMDTIARNALIRQAIFGLPGNITRAEFPGFITKSWCGLHHREYDHKCCGSVVPTIPRFHDASREIGCTICRSYVLSFNDSTLNSNYNNNRGISTGNEVYLTTKGNAIAFTDANLVNGQVHHHAADEGDVVDYV